MDVVRDLLDQPVIDRHRRPMGRVDGIVLELRDDAPPRLGALVIGPVALGQRLHPAIGRWVARVESVLGISRGRPVEIGASAFAVEKNEVRVDVVGSETPATIVERGLRSWMDRWRALR